MLRYLLISSLLFAGCDTGMITPDDDDSGPGGDAGVDALPPMDTGPGGDAGPSGDDPRALYERDVHPQMLADCAVCHEPGGVARYAFINTPVDDYAAAFALSGFVDLMNPEQSRILAKGVHDGPAWRPEQHDAILNWIEAEAGDTPEVTYIAPTPVSYGFNNYNLGVLGAAGSALTFVVADYDTGLLLTDVTLVAGPDGLLVELPTIEIWEGDSVIRTATLFADGELRIEPGDNVNLGEFYIEDIPSGVLMGARFGEIRTIRGGVDPYAECRNVPAFTEYAQPVLNDFCVECHTVEPAAIAAMDLQDLSDVLDADDQQYSCDQVLQHINRARPADSNLLRNADPRLEDVENHDFVFDDVAQLDAFKTEVFLWLTVEPL